MWLPSFAFSRVSILKTLMCVHSTQVPRIKAININIILQDNEIIVHKVCASSRMIIIMRDQFIKNVNEDALFSYEFLLNLVLDVHGVATMAEVFNSSTGGTESSCNMGKVPLWLS